MTELDAAPRTRRAGPAVPTGTAQTAHRPLAGPGAALTAGLLHDWQRRNREASLGLALRVPAWSGTPRLRVNGELTDPGPASRGYLTVTRVWQPGDVLAWTFDLTPRWVYPHPRIDSVRGCTAVERGPLVYCFEQVDQAHELDDLALAAGTELAERAATLPEIGRTVLVEADAEPVAAASAGTQRATAMPYFQWDNRDGRPMRVWLPAIMA